MAARKFKFWGWIAGMVLAAVFLWLFFIGRTHYGTMVPEKLPLSSGWLLQDSALVPQSGADLSAPSFSPGGWHAATVPGTVLTSLVDDGTYPEPLYGENNRPDKIPESLCRTDWWYRTTFPVPADYAGRKIWLHFDGINYAAEVWVNGLCAGGIVGAFIRGRFDVASWVSPGQPAAVAVRVSPQPHPGHPNEHTLRDGTGRNGGITAIDGPTFLCSIGWDWIPAIRDRNTGIWRGVSLSASGPVTIEDPSVRADLAAPSLQSASVTAGARLVNHTGRAQRGWLRGEMAGVGEGIVHFEREIALPPNGSQVVSFHPADTPRMRIEHPRLWWPNGYGPQQLARLRLAFVTEDHRESDTCEVNFGIRKITYSVPGSKNLTLSVNGVRVFCRGGNWGMDEALKRIPRERLEAQIRMHRHANLNMIRNWVGQSTNEDFYSLCDQYGILVWDEFFQPNPCDGPNPADLAVYLANVRDKVLRFRNHPCIALWCGRNEGPPPPRLDAAFRRLMAELDPGRHYQPSSTAGGGVRSGGPYHWRPPAAFYRGKEAFKTEIGSVSIPTVESIKGMMPARDWETINDAWAAHDLCRGAQRGDRYPALLGARYGAIANLADFARKGQLANYEAFRAMFEGRNARLFHPCNGILTWMSHPAQPSFVWQLYHHDLEANASLYAVRKACEPVHIQMNEDDGSIAVINHLPILLSGATARLRMFNPDGALAADRTVPVTAAPCLATDLGPIAWPAGLASIHFVKLELRDAVGALISDNFYWRAGRSSRGDFRELESLPRAGLDLNATVAGVEGGREVSVTIHNPSASIALMTHLQLRGAASGARVLPAFYSDNYFSLLPGETKSVTIDAAEADFHGEAPAIAVDGWNVGVAGATAGRVPIVLNADAQVDQWPWTGLPVKEARRRFFQRNRLPGVQPPATRTQ